MRFQSITLACLCLANAWAAADPTVHQGRHAVAVPEPRACPKGRHLCGTVCVNLRRDRKNCGACGTACGDDEVCAHRKCQPITCTNVIDCANGVAGGQVHCGAAPIPKTAKCYCADVDGSSGSGICTLAQPCENIIPCASSDDCDPHSICTLRSCCTADGMGQCVKKYAAKCANQSSASRIFEVGEGGTVLGGKMSDGS